MMKKMWPVVSVAAVACSVLLNGCATPRPLERVQNGLWRCGEPRTAAGWHQLATNGITHAVALNAARPWDRYAATNGIIIRRFTITTVEQTIGVPDPSKVRAALAAIGTNGCVVFCDHGEDRTGLIVAKWRVAHGWTRAKAEREMLAHGFHPWLRGLYWSWEEADP